MEKAAKWSTHWVVASALAGSNPVLLPNIKESSND